MDASGFDIWCVSILASARDRLSVELIFLRSPLCFPPPRSSFLLIFSSYITNLSLIVVCATGLLPCLDRMADVFAATGDVSNFYKHVWSMFYPVFYKALTDHITFQYSLMVTIPLSLAFCKTQQTEHFSGCPGTYLTVSRSLITNNIVLTFLTGMQGFAQVTAQLFLGWRVHLVLKQKLLTALIIASTIIAFCEFVSLLNQFVEAHLYRQY